MQRQNEEIEKRLEVTCNARYSLSGRRITRDRVTGGRSTGADERKVG